MWMFFLYYFISSVIENEKVGKLVTICFSFIKTIFNTTSLKILKSDCQKITKVAFKYQPFFDRFII